MQKFLTAEDAEGAEKNLERLHAFLIAGLLSGLMLAAFISREAKE